MTGPHPGPIKQETLQDAWVLVLKFLRELNVHSTPTHTYTFYFKHKDSTNSNTGDVIPAGDFLQDCPQKRVQ